MKTLLAALVFSSGLLAFGCSAGSGDVGSSGQEVTGASVSSIAAANIGGTACGKNSSGGYDFDSSAAPATAVTPSTGAPTSRDGSGGRRGADTNGLTAGAGSFYVYGQNNGTLSSTPHVGDAVVFNYSGGGYADHVAIVSR